MTRSLPVLLAAALTIPFSPATAQQPVEQQESPNFFDLSITPQYQGLSRDGGHNGNYEVDFVGLTTLRQGAAGDTRLAWWWLYNRTWSGLSTGALSRRAGLLWNINDGDAPDPEDALGVFAIQQMFSGGRVMLQLGKLYPGNEFAESDYWGDDRETFLSEMISSDPAGRWFANIGLGAHLAWQGDSWSVQAAIVDAQAVKPYFDFSSPGKGKFLWLAEFGFTPDWGGDNTQVSLTPYMIDRTDQLSRESGLVLGATHEWNDWAAFGRYTWRNGGAALTPADRGEELTVQRGGFVGLARNRPFGRENDRIAVALMHGEPTPLARTHGLNTQTGIEAYWSIRPNPWIAFTPDIQIVRTASGRTETILGLMLKVRFQKSWR